jgi:hypothetical protein
MSRTGITALAVSAAALAALSSASAFGQAARSNPANNGWSPGAAGNNPSNNGDSGQSYDPYRAYNEAARDAPQMFRFPGLSNKSGNPGCMAGSAQNKNRPKVVATFPANGAVVRPGVVVVRVTFDQPMACDASFDGVSDLPNPCPGRWREVTLSRDQRSFRTVCEVKANTTYRMTLRSFRNSHGLAVPAAVTFSTSGAAPIATIQQALAEDIGGPEIAGG